MGKKTKIDWCDASWNPVTGCLHGCKYCYARRIARRFCTNEHGKDDVGVAHPCTGDCQFCSELDGLEFVGQKWRWNHNKKEPYPYGFWPTFHPHRLDEPARWTKPRTIFVCSMADLFGNWVEDEWITEVFDACRKAPQHRYLFLTKNPQRYDDLAKKGLLPGDKNFWYGTSTPTPVDPYWFSDAHNVFTSIEPILAPFGYYSWREQEVPTMPKWAIIGAETGNRKDKVAPEKSWILDFAKSCKENGIAVFMKESLRELMDEDFSQEFPW